MAHEYQGGVEVLVVLLDVVGIVFGRFPLVHRVEVDAGIVSLDGLKESSESILKAGSIQRPATQETEVAGRTTWDLFAEVEARYRSFRRFQRHP
jgi:hypothetical protein